MANQADVAKLVSMLSAGYPNWQPNAFTVEVYYQDLQDIPADLLQIAAKHCRTSLTRDQRFAPSAGEIRLAVADIKRQAQGVPSGIEAWSELLHVPPTEQTRRVTDEQDENGSTIIEVAPYQWSHPLVRKVAVMMGFPKFPDWNSESFERTAFLKAYEIELQSYLKQDNQIPEVTRFIESTKRGELTTGQALTQLTKGMETK